MTTTETVSELPERINMMKVISLDVAEVVKLIVSENPDRTQEVTIEDVMERVKGWAQVGRNWAHEDFGVVGSAKFLVYQDENGEEL